MSAELVVAAALRAEVRALRRAGLAVLRSGVGPRRARRAARRLRAAPARAVAIAGLCGALDPKLGVGDVVVATSILGTAAAPAATDRLCAALRALGCVVHTGCVASAEHLVRGPERVALHARGAAVVDMESAWLQAGAAGRPLAVLRVVSDGPRRELLRPRAVADLLRALRVLRRAAPALECWAAELADPRPAATPARPIFGGPGAEPVREGAGVPVGGE